MRSKIVAAAAAGIAALAVFALSEPEKPVVIDNATDAEDFKAAMAMLESLMSPKAYAQGTTQAEFDGAVACCRGVGPEMGKNAEGRLVYKLCETWGSCKNGEPDAKCSSHVFKASGYSSDGSVSCTELQN